MNIDPNTTMAEQRMITVHDIVRTIDRELFEYGAPVRGEIGRRQGHVSEDIHFGRTRLARHPPMPVLARTVTLISPYDSLHGGSPDVG